MGLAGAQKDATLVEKVRSLAEAGIGEAIALLTKLSLRQDR